jgi:hypothetical protein
MTTVRGYKIKIERTPPGDPLNERSSTIFTALPREGGPGYQLRLDAWGNGEVSLSVWTDEDAGESLWEGKLIAQGARVRIETREARSNGSYTVLRAPAPAPPPLGEQADVLAAELRAAIDAALPAAPPDRLAAFRALEPGATLYDRASGRAVGTFERAEGDCVLLRSAITGGTTWSSGRALTTSAPGC